ncbi:MAG: UPF0175 family protein, partial [SAR324 cluster bacterium]|nr:UPF0175 family protein [SAR324 cluster bacterium]
PAQCGVKMQKLSISYPDDLLVMSGKTPQTLAAEMQFLLAVKLFEMHRLTLGKAAAFCGMDKLHFMFELGRLEIPVINLEADQIQDELRNG